MLLHKGLHVRQLEPNHSPRPLAVPHARNTDAGKLPPLRQLVNEGQADLENPLHLFGVKQLHFEALSWSSAFF